VLINKIINICCTYLYVPYNSKLLTLFFKLYFLFRMKFGVLLALFGVLFVNVLGTSKYLTHELDSKYQYVTPRTSWISAHSAHNRGLHPTQLNTLSPHGVKQHVHKAIMSFELNDQTYELVMEKNAYLIPGGYVERVVDGNGESQLRTETHREHCWYACCPSLSTP